MKWPQFTLGQLFAIAALFGLGLALIVEGWSSKYDYPNDPFPVLSVGLGMIGAGAGLAIEGPRLGVLLGLFCLGLVPTTFVLGVCFFGGWLIMSALFRSLFL